MQAFTNIKDIQQEIIQLIIEKDISMFDPCNNILLNKLGLGNVY